ncbi:MULTISPECIES: DUF2232 domain-containing protein [Terrabacteria group]|uniref:DUF2232 domain-containing protein n=1 Tax=Bacillati TaxID=1783272 RepID=UPI001C6F2E27|nr:MULTISPECIES: DUF2232 domain-containing protein [Terrabacteria group]MBW9212622.1 YybS family protein [Trueperella sp. zg.1013]
MKKATLQTTEGAMILAMMGVFLLIDRQLAGGLSSIFAFVMPLPMAVYTRKHSEKAGIIVLIAAFFLNVLLVSPLSLFLVSAEEVIGFFYGYLANKGNSFKQILWKLMVVGVVVQLIDFTISLKVFGISLDQQSQEMAELFPSLTRMYQPSVLKNLVYLSSILLGILQALSTCLLSQILLDRLKIASPAFERFNKQRTKPLYGYLASFATILFVYLMRQPLQQELLQMLGLTIGLLGFLYLLFWGCLTVSIWLMRFHFPRMVSVLLVLIVAFLLSYVIVLIGMVSVFYPKIRG